MRRFVVIVLLLFAVSAASASAAPVFVLTGRGYGHGVGMSQYGAQGFALHGSTYRAILAHYYAGTAVAPGYRTTVRVLLASTRRSVTIGSDGSFSLAGQALAPGSYRVTPGDGRITVTANGTSKTAASPATVSPATSSPVTLDGLPYRGDLLVALASSRNALDVANRLGLEGYVMGVLGREMPSAWEFEALKVQAVAARTYALATGGHCRWEGVERVVFCPDTRDQVYGGKSAETTATNAAVRATDGEAVTYEDAAGSTHLATTHFFSTSGGRTCATADCWGNAVSYLVSVADPYDRISPHHLWGPLDGEVDCPGTSPDCVFTASGLERALGLAQRPRDVTVALNASSRVRSVEVAGATTATTVAGSTMRTQLGLRSTWFRIGVLSLAADKRTVEYGRSITLAGLARRGGTRAWGSAYLQRRRYGEASWTTVGTAVPDGAWSSTKRPRIRSDYRVVSRNATGIAERVHVRTKVVFTTVSPRRLRGTLGPAKSGVTVTLSRQRSDGTWRTVATTTTRSDGTFVFPISARGKYRALADAGAGYLRGSAVTLVAG